MIKVYIATEPWSAKIGILFTEERNGKRYVVKPVDLVFEEVKDNSATEPTIRFDHFLAPEFLKALAEALDKHNIKTENDFKIQGLLEATKYHLEDMRKITFNNLSPRKEG